MIYLTEQQFIFNDCASHFIVGINAENDDKPNKQFTYNGSICCPKSERERSQTDMFPRGPQREDRLNDIWHKEMLFSDPNDN